MYWVVWGGFFVWFLELGKECDYDIDSKEGDDKKIWKCFFEWIIGVGFWLNRL